MSINTTAIKSYLSNEDTISQRLDKIDADMRRITRSIELEKGSLPLWQKTSLRLWKLFDQSTYKNPDVQAVQALILQKRELEQQRSKLQEHLLDIEAAILENFDKSVVLSDWFVIEANELLHTTSRLIEDFRSYIQIIQHAKQYKNTAMRMEWLDTFVDNRSQVWAAVSHYSASKTSNLQEIISYLWHERGRMMYEMKSIHPSVWNIRGSAGQALQRYQKGWRIERLESGSDLMEFVLGQNTAYSNVMSVLALRRTSKAWDLLAKLETEAEVSIKNLQWLHQAIQTNKENYIVNTLAKKVI